MLSKATVGGEGRGALTMTPVRTNSVIMTPIVLRPERNCQHVRMTSESDTHTILRFLGHRSKILLHLLIISIQNNWCLLKHSNTTACRGLYFLCAFTAICFAITNKQTSSIFWSGYGQRWRSTAGAM